MRTDFTLPTMDNCNGNNVMTANDEQMKQQMMNEFKSDSDKMVEINRFIDDIIINAKNEANKQLNAKEAKERENLIGGPRSLLTGVKRGRILTRVRGAVVRLFEAICNCSTTSTPQISNATLTK